MTALKERVSESSTSTRSSRRGNRPGRTSSPLVPKALVAVCGLAIACMFLLPVVWMFLTAFKAESDIVAFPPTLWPRSLSLEHFGEIWTQIPFAQLYLNSFIFAGSVTVISLLLDSMAAYALARLKFRGSGLVTIMVLLLLMLPFQVTLIPLYDMLSGWGLTNTLPGLIIPRVTNAFGIFFLRQFFLSLPSDLEEAARVDGASEWRIYWQVIMPLARPALLTLGLFHFQYNWNDLLWPLIMSNDMSTATLPAGLALFMGQHVVQYGMLMAGAVLATLPVVVFFLLIQRSFVQGIATTGLK
jgi:multiple sugar transport system permease protein